MKKLMFAAAAVMGISAAFAIESANIVGYSSNNLRYGSIGLVPQFMGISSADGSIDLQDIKCGAGCSDSVGLSLLDSIGIAGDSYSWIDWYDPSGTGEGPTEACWVDGTYTKVTDFKIAPGQGLWIQGENADQLLQSSGQVTTSDVAVQLRYGSTMTGNPTPVEIDLQDVICGAGCSDSVGLSLLDSIGIAGDSYSWIDWYDPSGTGEGPTEACWVDGTYTKVTDFKIAPGQGLWIQAENSDQYITFPGVEL